ncbi:MAG: 7-carboxy-7-deazaguanine synthase [Pseudomonadota bacterium]
MVYSVKEIFMTLQGEGAHAGRAALFIRFTGCNLWNGLEQSRETAKCRFCDTDFVGTDGQNGGKFKTPEALISAADRLWTGGDAHKFCVITGGEPLLQLDELLIDALHVAGYMIAVETNGTLAPPAGIDWLCVSPKAGQALQVFSGNELKLVYPQEGAPPGFFEALDFEHFFLQPMDNHAKNQNTEKAIAYCMQNPKWRLSVQTHKILNID